MDIELMLKELGLSGNEAKIYLELLKRGSISANELAKKTGFDRSLIYQILENLIEKGLTSYIIKENKKYFEASPPDNLLNPIKEKESLALKLIPQLKSIEKVKEESQKVNIYEGKKGLRLLLEDMIKAKKIYFFGATGRTYNLMNFELSHLIKKAQKLGLKGKMITSEEYKNHPMTKIKGMKIKFLDVVKGPATTSIYENKVSIHLLTEKPIIILIENEEIAKSYKEYFEFLWKIAN